MPQASQDTRNDGGEDNAARDTRPPSPSRVIASALKEFNPKPQLLADKLRTHLRPNGVKALLTVLADAP